MIRRPPRSTLDRSSAASDVYKRQVLVVPGRHGDVGLAGVGEQLAVRGHEDRGVEAEAVVGACLLYTSPSPRDRTRSRMPSSA